MTPEELKRDLDEWNAYCLREFRKVGGHWVGITDGVVATASDEPLEDYLQSLNSPPKPDRAQRAREAMLVARFLPEAEAEANGWFSRWGCP